MSIMHRNLGNELFLLMGNLSKVTDCREVIRLFTEGLSSMFEDVEFEYAPDADPLKRFSLELATSTTNMGHIFVKGPWENFSPDVRALIGNSVSMLASILANHFEAEQLAKEKDLLETEVAKRTEELLEAKQSLEAKTRELARYFTTSKALLGIADTDGYLLRMNNEWQRTLGYAPSEPEDRNLIDFVHPDNVEATEAALSQLKRQEEVLGVENRFRCKDDSYRWLE